MGRRLTFDFFLLNAPFCLMWKNEAIRHYFCHFDFIHLLSFYSAFFLFSAPDQPWMVFLTTPSPIIVSLSVVSPEPYSSRFV